MASPPLPEGASARGVGVAPTDIARPIAIALAGNPNCGKTTLFNALTGLKYKVANYPGVTVEKKSGRLCLPDFRNVTLVDLPGIYSLAGTSADERIATQYLTGELKTEQKPDVLVATIDASNIERNLYLVSQLVDTGIPLILVLNMVDVAEKNGIKIYTDLLARQLDLPVIPLIANKGVGLDKLREAICLMLHSPRVSSQRHGWLPTTSSFRAHATSLGWMYTAETRIDFPNGVEIIGGALLSDAIAPSSPHLKKEIDSSRHALLKDGIDPLTFEATARYHWIHDIVRKACVFTSPSTRSLASRIDHVLTHKVWGSMAFLVIMAVIFQSIFMWSQLPMDFIDGAINSFGNWVSLQLPEGQLRSLIVDGVIAGVGSVLIFVPQIAVLFFFLGLLEDSGYLSRAAFLMDNVMRRVGLQGRSFIPLLSSFACAIPGIMSTRTIPTWADRLATILIAPLMSCSARLPVYAVLIAAFIPNDYLFGFISLQAITLLSMYLLGIIGAALVAWILKMTILKREPAFFVMEMPQFRAPSLRIVLREVVDRVVTFLKSAGTVILACSIILWFLATHPQNSAIDGQHQLKESYAGQIGSLMEPVIRPLGFNWEIGIGILASFAAREVFVSSLATIYNVGDDDDTSQSLISVLKGKKGDGSFSLASALSLMVFYVFACQCMSTLAICKRETGSWRWVAFMFTYMTALAYSASFATFWIASSFGG